MNLKLAAVGATLAAATVGSIAFGAGPASANMVTWLSTSHSVGIYNYSSVGSGKTYPGNEWDLTPPSPSYSGDGVDAVCWIRGDDLQNLGNVWYYIDSGYYAWAGGWVSQNGYVYGGYVDGNAAYHNGLQHCSWGA
jgi:hypothetical protein